MPFDTPVKSSLRWPQLSLSDLKTTTSTTLDRETYSTTEQIVTDVRNRGLVALREISVSFGDIGADDKLVIHPSELFEQLKKIDSSTRKLLQRTSDQIRRYAEAQRGTISDFNLPIEGGVAGHRWMPLLAAGCYAPGGRYPLPSSVLMSAVTARVAGVERVWIASPNPTPEVMAAAAIARADGLLAVGGAQAIAALAYGVKGLISQCDVVVGPGNRFVTAAKAIVSRDTRIDMLAGPSELVIVASSDADAEFVAADLIAQAEHDFDARPFLVTDSASFAEQVYEAVKLQLHTLPTKEVAASAFAGGGFLIAASAEQALEICRIIAPEHLSLQGQKFEQLADRFEMGAALFVGSEAAEVLGDYGAGPNHVLPTGGGARSNSGLSIMSFMRFQTRLQINDLSKAQSLVGDAAALGRIEGLEGHARSAERRLM